jgi:hypothetical protein
LRQAHDSEVVVVDLRKGRTWWETRLCVLVAGAASRDRPQAIAFTADRNGRTGVFLGWAPPSSLLELHRSAEPGFARAHDSALALAAQWRLGLPPPGQNGEPSYVELPWNNASLYLPTLADDASDPAFALELFLQAELEGSGQELRRHVTIRRLLELYEPCSSPIRSRQTPTTRHGRRPCRAARGGSSRSPPLTGCAPSSRAKC